MRATNLMGMSKLILFAAVLAAVNTRSVGADDQSQFIRHLRAASPGDPVTFASQVKPYIKGIPDGTMPSGQMEANSVVVWNAGSDYPYCEVYMNVNNGEDIELGRGHDGKKSIVVRRGSTYDFKMLVYLGDRGDDVREIATLTFVGRTETSTTGTLGRRRGSAASPQREAPNTPGSGRFGDKRGNTSSSITKLPFFYGVRLTPAGDAIDLSFETFEPSEFFIEVSKESPVSGLPTETPAGQKLPAAFPSGTRLAAYTLPGLSGVKKQHQATVRSAPGQVFEANAQYHYVITAKTQDGSFRRYVGEFTNLSRTVHIVWERVKIISDGDPDPPFGSDCGEIDLWFWTNHGTPNSNLFILNQLGGRSGACTDHEYDIRRDVYIQNAGDILSLSVSGRDSDTDQPTGSDLYGPAEPAPFTGPRDTGNEEQNVASYEFDLRQIEVNTTIPFKLVSMKADGGDQGDLTFEVYGRIVITPSRGGK